GPSAVGTTSYLNFDPATYCWRLAQLPSCPINVNDRVAIFVRKIFHERAFLGNAEIGQRADNTYLFCLFAVGINMEIFRLYTNELLIARQDRVANPVNDGRFSRVVAPHKSGQSRMKTKAQL